MVIEVPPRVRGLWGCCGAFIFCLEMNYLELDDDTHSRKYLIAMESYLVKDGDYGIVK